MNCLPVQLPRRSNPPTVSLLQGDQSLPPSFMKADHRQSPAESLVKLIRGFNSIQDKDCTFTLAHPTKQDTAKGYIFSLRSPLLQASWYSYFPRTSSKLHIPECSSFLFFQAISPCILYFAVVVTIVINYSDKVGLLKQNANSTRTGIKSILFI